MHHIMDVKWVVNAVADVETQQIACGRLLVQVPLRCLTCWRFIIKFPLVMHGKVWACHGNVW